MERSSTHGSAGGNPGSRADPDLADVIRNKISLASKQRLIVKNIKRTIKTEFQPRPPIPMSSPHSNPHAADEASSAVDPGSGLISTIAELLMPLFKTSSIDRQLAEQMATSAIEAYRPETR